MAIQKTEGVILKAERFREKSLLIDFYTREFGKIKGLLKGKASIQSPVYTEILFYPRKKGLHFISECHLKDSFANLNKSLLALGAANYFSELVNELTFPEHEDKRLFDLLLPAISFLAKKNILDPDIKQLISVFEIKLLSLLGVFPSLENLPNLYLRSVGGSALPGTVACLSYLKKEGIKKGLSLRISPQINKQINEVLKNLLSSHLQKELKTQEFLEKVIVASYKPQVSSYKQEKPKV
ncbi:MAG: DNA repair protein RecO [Candidatus Omnitrophica bacterium]|nr:DNA repair protein RecO [Candidatus Omnitrophota bacterium]